MNRLNVRLASSNTASSVDLGLFAGGTATAAGDRLAGCVVSQPKAGALNSCAIDPVNVTPGASYWTAILQPSGSSGSLWYLNAAGGRTFGSASSSLTALLSSWQNGPDWGSQTASLFADEAPSSSATTAAAFTWSPTSSQAGQAVRFDGSASTCAASPCTYRWEDDGPDGAGGTQWPLGTGQSISFTFRQAGVKYVRLTVTDGRGATATDEHDLSVTAAQSATPTPTPTPTPSPFQDSSPSPAPTPGANQFPSPATTGHAANWTPTVTRSTDMTVSTPGTVLNGYLFTNGARLNIDADNVRVVNSEFRGGWIDTANRDVVVQDTTFNRDDPEATTVEGAVSYCGYTAERVKIIDRTEGFRSGCSAPVVIKDSFVSITPPDACVDWHGDGLQGYTGGPTTITNTTIDFNEGYGTPNFCGGTAPVFYPDQQGNTRLDVNHLLVSGGGASFRDGMPGNVQDLQIACNTPGTDSCWHFGPIDVRCGAVTSWQATVVKVDEANWTTTKQYDQPCNTQ